MARPLTRGVTYVAFLLATSALQVGCSSHSAGGGDADAPNSPPAETGAMVDAAGVIDDSGGMDIATPDISVSEVAVATDAPSDITSAACETSDCLPPVFANVCGATGAIVVSDGLGPDDAAAQVVAGALGSCAPPVPVRMVSQDSAVGVLDPSNKKPVVGPGNTLIIAGGPFVQHALGYLDQALLTPVYFTAGGVGGNDYFVRSRATGTPIVTTTANAITTHHDYFVIELVKEPSTGTVSLVTYGWRDPGTAAAVWYFANVLFTAAPDSATSWRVVEWTDVNMDSMPNAGEFALVASGK